MEKYKIHIGGQDVIVTYWGENDYDVYFADDDYSVRGSFEDIVEEILENAKAEWRIRLAAFVKGALD